MGSIDGQLQYFNPNTLDGLNPVLQDISTNALLVDGTNSMLADLDMGGHQIVNLQPGIAPNDAVTVSQLAPYALDATVVHIAGTETITGNKTFQGTLSAGQVYGTGATFPTYISNIQRLRVSASGTTVFMDAGNTASPAVLATNGTAQIGLFNSLTAGAYNPGTVAGDAGVFSINSAGANTSNLMLAPHTSGTASGLRLTPSAATMYTTMSMNGKKITSLANGTVPSDAATYGQLTSGLANYLPLAGGTMTGAINMGSQKITSLANGTAPTDAAAYGQVTAVDANCVHLTGNETIGGIKTFTSSPIVPAQPTTYTQAASQKMIVGPRGVSWVVSFVTVEQSTPGGLYDLVAENRNVAYSPFEIGTTPLQGQGIGSSSTLNELHVSTAFMHAALPLTGMIVHASNLKDPFGLQQYPTVRVGIWEADTGNLVASSNNTNLRWFLGLPNASFEFDNYYVPFTATFTPTISKLYVYGVWWITLNDRTTNNNLTRVTTVNNGDVFQISMAANYNSDIRKLSAGRKTGVTTFPTTLTNTGWIQHTGKWCFFVVGDYSTVW